MSVVIPDKIEPEVGWRVWALLKHAPSGTWRLGSCNHTTVWPVKEPLEALCHGNQNHVIYFGPQPPPLPPYATVHDAPSGDCSCGIYAAKLDEAVNYMSPFSVLGRVSLWGVVVPGEHGFRAQFAYPASLVRPTEWLRTLLQNDKTEEWEEAFESVVQLYDLPTEPTDERSEISIGHAALTALIRRAPMYGVPLPQIKVPALPAISAPQAASRSPLSVFKFRSP